jgi:RimJ/RimL family protein N-acetyltransferase
MKLDLVSVYHATGADRILYDLLAERESYTRISHKAMPSFEEHKTFMRSIPYQVWYLIDSDEHLKAVGSIYLTRAREVGLFVFKACRGQGIGAAALALLREKHPGPLLANINPGNRRSRNFFVRNGFKLKQVTYAAEPE